MYVLGQCEGDLGSGDCVNCVKMVLAELKVSVGTRFLHKFICNSATLATPIILMVCQVNHYLPQEQDRILKRLLL